MGRQDPLMPIAQLSIFGWLVLGPVDTSSSASAAVHHASIQEREDALDELLAKFWTQEEVPASNNHELTPDEQRCEEYYKSTVSRDSTGRYTFMTEYRELNHMKKASPTSSQHTQYYLPHHGVLRPDSATTKLRVVFNGSSASTSGRSLNDLMPTGAKQINVHEDDWNLQRILWIDEQLNEMSYHLTTVTYGNKAAPFLAVPTLPQLVEDEGHNFPLAVPSIIQGR
ncbi:uncharacterized protein [Temnothorax nylanderi]|uniref:uncharacterized protein n=1 Tax=Temnothorax nylanderi TaxID=102681 RepID=UPI003A88F783